MEINRYNYNKIHSVKGGDRVVFTDSIVYMVTDSFLNCPAHLNDRIFREMGVSGKEFCAKAYGYQPGFGDWPTYKPGDYGAAYRVIVAIFEKLYPTPPTSKTGSIGDDLPFFESAYVQTCSSEKSGSIDSIRIETNPLEYIPKIIL